MTLQRSAQPLRKLSAKDLGVGAAPAIKQHTSNQPDDPVVADDHPILLQVQDLLQFYGGVIFTGPPGTSKSYYAAAIGKKLASDDSRIRFVQFHPSYQYEDFMQGFVPKTTGDGFEMKPRTFVTMCREAGENPNSTYVIVIDELSRGDSGRIFGEALTYVEKSKRGLDCDLASGEQLIVPPNLVILATMNPLDRGVDEVDAAFERRFAKIPMEPDRDYLRTRLNDNGLPQPLVPRVVGFFDKVGGLAKTTPQGAVGHTFFNDVVDEASLRRVWDYQLRFLFEKAYRLDPDTLQMIEGSFEQIFDVATDSGQTEQDDT